MIDFRKTTKIISIYIVVLFFSIFYVGTPFSTIVYGSELSESGSSDGGESAGSDSSGSDGGESTGNDSSGNEENENSESSSSNDTEHSTEDDNNITDSSEGVDVNEVEITDESDLVFIDTDESDYGENIADESAITENTDVAENEVVNSEENDIQENSEEQEHLLNEDATLTDSESLDYEETLIEEICPLDVTYPKETPFIIVLDEYSKRGIVNSDDFLITNNEPETIEVSLLSARVIIDKLEDFSISTERVLPEEGSNIYIEFKTVHNGISLTAPLTKDITNPGISFSLESGETASFCLSGTANEFGNIPWSEAVITVEFSIDITDPNFEEHKEDYNEEKPQYNDEHENEVVAEEIKEVVEETMTEEIAPEETVAVEAVPEEIILEEAEENEPEAVENNESNETQDEYEDVPEATEEYNEEKEMDFISEIE